MAPFFIKPFDPIAFLFSMELGIQNIFFPCCFAYLAVIPVPLLFLASTISIPGT